MSTTLHSHIEVRIGDQWHHYHAPIVDTNYKLFGLIAGVRTDVGYVVAKNRTMPEDISPVTAIAYESDKGIGVHDTVVLDAADIKELQSRIYDVVYPNVAPTGIDEGDLEYSIFKTYIAGNTIAAHEGFDDVRIVCWFDN